MKREMRHDKQTIPWLDEDDVLRQIRSVGLIAIIRADARVDVLLEVADALLASPLTIAALLLGYANSLAAIAEMRARMGEHMLIGAANVRTRSQAVAALDAGAQFLVAPIFDQSAFQAAADRMALYIPTMRALDEIERLVNAGVRSVRVEMDDADNQGAILLDALTGKNPPLEVVVSGAATPENLASWAQKGVLAACVGDELLHEETWSAKTLITQTRALRTAWEAGRR
jgi:2-dehydro-3-deoxyphosphogluconate aldolase/(4S)-4-hydroxy-2-oxoglutarate aldolase